MECAIPLYLLIQIAQQEFPGRLDRRWTLSFFKANRRIERLKLCAVWILSSLTAVRRRVSGRRRQS
jgi:hypothetical protein